MGTNIGRALRIAIVCAAVAALLVAVFAMNNGGRTGEPTGPQRLNNVDLITDTATTTITTFTYTGTAFVGDIDSDEAGCVEGRTVNVVYVNPLASGGSVPVGSDTTDASGAFSVSDPLPVPGTYQATVTEGTSGDHTCAPDSEQTTVDGP